MSSALSHIGGGVAHLSRKLTRTAVEHPSQSALAGLWVAFTAYKLWLALSGTALVWIDSQTYEAVARFPLFSSGFLVGQRPVAVPLLWKITGTGTSFVATQTVISALAWGFFAFAATTRVRGARRSIFSGILVLAFAITPQVELWDQSILSESLALSCLALLGAQAIWNRRLSPLRVVAIVLTAIVFVEVRDEDTWAILLAFIAFAIVALRTRVVRRQWPRAIVLLSAMFLAISCTAEGIAIASQRNVQNVEHVMQDRIFPYPDRVAWFAAHGMPDASEILAVTPSPPVVPGYGPTVNIDFLSPRYSQLNDWFTKNGERTYLDWLVLHPGYDLTSPFQTPTLSEYDPSNGLAGYARSIPGWLRGLGQAMFPPWQVVVLLALIASILLMRFREWRERHVQLSVLFIVVGLLTMLIAWHGDGYEVVRHMLEGNIAARMGTLLLLIFGIFGNGRQDQLEVTNTEI